MREIDRMGVSIDLCPGCKGIWLDRGELEKLVEMSRGETTTAEAAPARSEARPESRGPELTYRETQTRHHDHDDDDHDHHRPSGPGHGADDRSSKPRQRGSWLTDLLEGIGGD